VILSFSKSLLKMWERVFFFLIGLAQTVYLLLHGHLIFYTMYPFGAFASLVAVRTPVFYAVHSSVLLLTHSLPLVTTVQIKDARTNGMTASMRLFYEDCSQSRILVQSAVPVDWSVAGDSLQLHHVTQFAQFRVVVFCENNRRPVASDVAFFDEFALYHLKGGMRAVDTSHDHRIQVLVDPVPTKNPWYTYQRRDRVLPVMWAILGARLATDYFRRTTGKI
jgi:hypothetical protein